MKKSLIKLITMNKTIYEINMPPIEVLGYEYGTCIYDLNLVQNKDLDRIKNIKLI